MASNSDFTISHQRKINNLKINYLQVVGPDVNLKLVHWEDRI